MNPHGIFECSGARSSDDQARINLEMEDREISPDHLMELVDLLVDFYRKSAFCKNIISSSEQQGGQLLTFGDFNFEVNYFLRNLRIVGKNDRIVSGELTDLLLVLVNEALNKEGKRLAGQGNFVVDSCGKDIHDRVNKVMLSPFSNGGHSQVLRNASWVDALVKVWMHYFSSRHVNRPIRNGFRKAWGASIPVDIEGASSEEAEEDAAAQAQRVNRDVLVVLGRELAGVALFVLKQRDGGHLGDKDVDRVAKFVPDLGFFDKWKYVGVGGGSIIQHAFHRRLTELINGAVIQQGGGENESSSEQENRANGENAAVGGEKEGEEGGGEEEGQRDGGTEGRRDGGTEGRRDGEEDAYRRGDTVIFSVLDHRVSFLK